MRWCYRIKLRLWLELPLQYGWAKALLCAVRGTRCYSRVEVLTAAKYGEVKARDVRLPALSRSQSFDGTFQILPKEVKSGYSIYQPAREAYYVGQ